MKINPRKAHYNLRLKATFENEVFQREAEEVFSGILDALMKKNELTEQGDLTFCNRDLIKKKLGNKIAEKYDHFLEKHMIGDDEYWFYVGLNNEPIEQMPITMSKAENGKITFEIQTWAKSSDLKSAWKSLQQWLAQQDNYKARLREPEDIQLLLVIHKLKNTKPRKTFSEIARILSDGSAPGYKAKRRYYDEEYIRKYYDQYKDRLR